MTRVYYREAVGALVVFDMTRLSTFQAVLKWKGDLDSKVAYEDALKEGRRMSNTSYLYYIVSFSKTHFCL